jgi:hypothetical protein
VKHAKEPELSKAKLVVLGIAILAIGVGAAAFSAGRSSSSQTSSSSTEATTKPPVVDKKDPYSQYRVKGWIAEENAKPGTTEWKIPDDRAMWAKVEGFLDTTSIDVGGSAVLKVSTRAKTWTVSAYRIGWYAGNGARLIWKSEPQPGVNQPKAVQNAATKTWSAPWAPSLTINADVTWPPGQYLLKLDSDDGGETFVPLVIRDDKSTSDLLMQSAVTTWQSYNGWGGASLYTGTNGRADVVSFDRPYTGNGSGEFLGELAKNHRGIIIPGHDEYYTVEMRKNLEAARDAGVNIGFFGANNVYRRIRLEDSPTGEARLEVNYRDATRDPLYGKDNERVTTSFRESPAANPESSLTGSYYECNPVEADWVVGDASMWMFEGSQFKNGDRVSKMVGNEYDRVTPGAPTPANIQVLAHSPVTCRGKASFADSTWYTVPSGAGVFTAATFGWSPRLLDACPAGPPTTPICKLQKLTENILNAFAEGPAGLKYPSVSNLAKFGIATPRAPSTSSSTTSTTVQR